MELQIRTFGIARDIVGGSTIAMELPQGTTVGSLQQQLFERFPRFVELASLRVAVNAELAEPNWVLSEKDEIALIPPVSGG